jgi:hypothetical protein
MKTSTLLVLACLGAIVYGLLSPQRSNETLATSTPSAELPVIPEPGPVTPYPVPMPTVHATSLVVIRGKVLETGGGRAQIDCDFVAPGSPESRIAPNGTAKAALAGSAAAQAQAQADLDTFGTLKMIDYAGRYREADIKPQRRIKGVVTLAGVVVLKGRTVHVVAAPITLEGEKFLIYTAKFQLTGGGGTWMWNGKGPLNQRAKPGL